MTIACRRGYTLVEIMIVVAIIAILLSVALPNYITSGRIAAKTVCIKNLREIDAAIDQWATDNDIRTGTIPSESQQVEIYGYIEGGKPRCPSGGEYVIYGFGDKPQVKCTQENEGHKLPV